MVNYRAKTFVSRPSVASLDRVIILARVRARARIRDARAAPATRASRRNIRAPSPWRAIGRRLFVVGVRERRGE
jgi:hypothetical protein